MTGSGVLLLPEVLLLLADDVSLDVGAADVVTSSCGFEAGDAVGSASSNG